MPHNGYMNKKIAHDLAVSAYMNGDADAIARYNREQGIIVTADRVLTEPEADDYEDTRELSDHEYDRIADRYERNWV